MKSDTTTKNTTTPQNNDPVLVALVLLALALEALARALRPLLAHALALVLTAAGWRPTPAAQDEGPKPNPQPIKTTSRPRRTRRTVPVAA